MFDENKKKVKLDNKIRKELSKSYRSSKFFKYPVVLEGVLSTDKKNRTFLILYDIFLKDEFEGKTQSRRYDLRYENLIFRFIDKSCKNVKVVFSHQFNETNLNLFINMFVKTDALDSVVFKKNTTKLFEDPETDFIKLNIWTEFSGTIVGYEIGESSKKEYDDKQNLVSETPFEYLKAFKIFNEAENETVLVELSNFTESEKINFLSNVKDYTDKKCVFKRYNVLNNIGYIFVEAK